MIKNQFLKARFIVPGAFFVGILSFAYMGAPIFSVKYGNENKQIATVNTQAIVNKKIQEKKEPEFIVTHIKTPDAVKALYMTSWVAGTRNIRERLINVVDTTEANSLVVDIKDYSGKIAFKTNTTLLKDIGASENRIPNIKEFIGYLHDKNIYVIGRITVFQDPFYTKVKPSVAVKKESNKSVVWKDYKGLSYVDVGSKEYWDYVVALSKESYDVGFDELNFDYIRFPSDGNMKDIYYPFSEDIVNLNPDLGKAIVLRNFFRYLHEELSGIDVKMSADLFGMAATNKDDLNIGQILEYAAPYFDYLAPMVYPSHYPKGFNGYNNVNKYPYEIVKLSMDEAVKRMISASTSPQKIRPWLQDFDYPVTYTPEMVRAQKKAVYDAGLNSWMMWDPTNIYTKSALDSK
jgi:hypothetical protein